MDSPKSILSSWKVHPARERWRTTLLTVGVTALAAWLVADIMEQPAWGLFAVLVVAVGCNRFFFPTRYELTTAGITAWFPLRTMKYDWPELRRFIYDKTGGFLSPRVRRSVLDEYRGISLLFGKDDNAEDITGQICGLLPKDAFVRNLTRPAVLTPKEQTPCGG